MKDKILTVQPAINATADHIELARLSRKLGIPVPIVHIQVKSTRAGAITGFYEGLSRTWTRNYWNILFASLCGLPTVATNFGAGYLSMKQVGGTVSAYTTPQNLTQSPVGPINNSAYGIIPGRGSTAENFDSYALATPITHGVSATQLSFRASSHSSAYTSETKLWTATISRLFDNLSGGSIVITESAIYAYFATMGWSLMNCRDLLASSVTVLDDGVLTIKYTITLTFPN